MKDVIEGCYPIARSGQSTPPRTLFGLTKKNSLSNNGRRETKAIQTHTANKSTVLIVSIVVRTILNRVHARYLGNVRFRTKL